MPWWRREFEANAPSRTVWLDAIPPDDMILDIGPQSIERVSRLDDARRWCGTGRSAPSS